MIPITIRQLQYFVAVYEEASFSKAAEREHSSQSALSTQIRNLETILERPLLERSVHGVTPTVDGQRFYRHAIAILRSVTAAKQEMAEINGSISGMVRLGLIPSVIRGLLPKFLPGFLERHPLVDVRIIQGFSAPVARAVLDNVVDLGVVLEPPRNEGIEITRLAAGRMVLVTGAQSGLRRGAPLRLADLPAFDFVVPSPDHTLRQIIERRIWTREIRVARLLEMDSVHGMVDLVRGSPNWATILPLVAVICDLDADDLCISPILEPQLEADIYLITLGRQPLSRAAQLLVEGLRQQIVAGETTLA